MNGLIKDLFDLGDGSSIEGRKEGFGESKDSSKKSS
jgi:hypothetical protein